MLDGSHPSYPWRYCSSFLIELIRPYAPLWRKSPTSSSSLANTCCASAWVSGPIRIAWLLLNGVGEDFPEILVGTAKPRPGLAEMELRCIARETSMIKTNGNGRCWRRQCGGKKRVYSLHVIFAQIRTALTDEAKNGVCCVERGIVQLYQIPRQRSLVAVVR